ncbi:MAG: NAD(+)/NADH kinase [Candidatus Ratteibacteria bacterium]|nr:NAD(+)/NADH kinase [Candidatus Ratteibacteria bacterium]
MKNIAIIANLAKEKVPTVIRKLIRDLEKRDVNIFLLEDAAKFLQRKDLRANGEKIRKNAQLLISLGGDGTLLKASRIVRGENIPILGVNMGSLGFLTEISYKNLSKALSMLFSKKYCIEKRNMLSIGVQDDKKRLFALNDVVLSRGASARIVELKTYVDGNYLTTFASDGLIVSSSTGSTAHSLSSGGPIVYPSMDCILIVPICPHTLSNRPLVVPSNSKIKVKMLTEGTVDYTIDGQICGKLNKGDEIEVRLAPFAVSLIRLKKKNFYELLRKKLKWSGSSVEK